MKYGLNLPNGGPGADARALAELARVAEETGWDGVFLEDYIVYHSGENPPTYDPWVALAAMAMHTEQIRLGTEVTPPIPIWVVGAWPRMKSVRRVLRCDGLLPAKLSDTGKHLEVKPDDVREMKAWIDETRTATSPFAIVVEGETPGDDPEAAAAKIRPWAQAGVTWWIECGPRMM